jgi:hypothetical protein
MKREMLKERVELLAIGEALGYPRLGIGHAAGRKQSIRAGQAEWEKFAAHAHTTRIPAALRVGRVLRDNGVMKFHPLSGREMEPVTPQGRPVGVTEKSEAATVPQASGIGSTAPSPSADLLDDFPDLHPPMPPTFQPLVPVKPAPRRKRDRTRPA